MPDLGGRRCRSLLALTAEQQARECFACTTTHGSEKPRKRTSVFTSPNASYTRTETSYHLQKGETTKKTTSWNVGPASSSSHRFSTENAALLEQFDAEMQTSHPSGYAVELAAQFRLKEKCGHLEIARKWEAFDTKLLSAILKISTRSLGRKLLKTLEILQEEMTKLIAHKFEGDFELYLDGLDTFLLMIQEEPDEDVLPELVEPLLREAEFVAPDVVDSDRAL